MRGTGDHQERGWAALDGRDNALNFIRLGLAACVVVAHSLGFTRGPDAVPFWLGRIAVLGFFAISGYLVTGSRMRLGFGSFMLRRGLRILPGLWICLLVTAFVFAPLTAFAAGVHYHLAEAGTYVVTNGNVMARGQPTIGDTLAGSPEAGEWNPSLWTLQWEVLCYLVCGILMAFAVMRRPVVVASGLAAAAVAALLVWSAVPGAAQSALQLGSCFAAGALLRLTRDRLPASGALAAAAAIIVAMLVAMFAPGEMWTALMPLPLAYLVLWLGITMPIRVGARNDISYGVYVYGTPVMQVAVAFGLGVLAPAWFALAAVGLAAGTGWMSWVLVERPAMHLRRHVPTRGWWSSHQPYVELSRRP